MNTLAQARTGQDQDPRLRGLFGYQGGEDAGARYGDPLNKSLDNAGGIVRNGQRYVQAGGDLGSYIQDKSQFIYDDEFGLLTPESNVKVKDSFLDKYGVPIAMAAFGGLAGAHAGAVGAAAGEAAGTGAFDVGGSTGFGGSTPLGEGLLPESYWGASADAGNVATDAGGGGWNGTFGQGGLDPETLGGQGGMGVSQNGIGPGGLMDRFAGAINNPSSLASENGLLRGGLSSAGSYAMDNPIRSLMLANTVAGSLGGGNKPAATSGNQSKGGSGAPVNIGTKRGGYQPNPITLKQLQQFLFSGAR